MTTEQLEQLVVHAQSDWLAEDLCVLVCNYCEYDMMRIEHFLVWLRARQVDVDELNTVSHEEGMRKLHMLVMNFLKQDALNKNK